MHTDLAIVIVSWNVADLLRRCLLAVESSLAGSGIRARVIVVDNASSDGSPDVVRAEFPAVELIEAGANLGFSGGNNLALRTLGFNTPVPHAPAAVLLLNPDTEPLADAIPLLVRFLEQHPDLVAVGPQLRYGDGSVQSSRRRFPTPGALFWESTPLERLWPNNPWAHRYHCADTADSVEQRPGWLVGAALLVRGTAIVQAGLLDEGFFLYSEELEWQLRLQGFGPPHRGAVARAAAQESRIAYLPSAVVLHHEGRSSAQVPARRHMAFQRSKLRLAHMLYGPLVAIPLRLFLLACYAGEWATEAAKWLLGHRRTLRRQRMQVYGEVIRRLVLGN